MNSDIEINIIPTKKEGSLLLATANITFDTYACGKITIKGFLVWKSERFNERIHERINITPPSKRVYTRYIAQVFIENKDKWYELEDLIYRAYIAKTSHRREEVNPDEIDI